MLICILRFLDLNIYQQVIIEKSGLGYHKY